GAGLALDTAKSYLETRKQFGQALKEFQGLQWRFADMATDLDAARRYLGERRQFGKALGEFQALQFKLADMATQLVAARLMVHTAARKLDARSADATTWCAMAKRFATDAGFEVANQALQLHGGYGYLADFPLERIVRDLRVHQILEGTNEIMRVITARELFRA
ncbi:MAG TPA: acyl-CoA dehydrogenase family protein, partial [Phenylobacterium sp.]|nr:acyl-CoA dehydrogenase family protein [Phenylobacterium sp.]